MAEDKKQTQEIVLCRSNTYTTSKFKISRGQSLPQNANDADRKTAIDSGLFGTPQELATILSKIKKRETIVGGQK